MSDLVTMARAAQHDDRLADGALYGKLADEIERLRSELIIQRDSQVSAVNQMLAAEVEADKLRKQLEQERKTMDVLESNARVQAHLLADTGRERDALHKQLEKARPERTILAETIHKARWPLDRQMAITPFSDEDRNGREYCLRIADAVLHLLTSALETGK